MDKINELLAKTESFDAFSINPARGRIIRDISKYGLAGSSVNETKPILKRNQLLQCIDGYMNNGTCRAMVNKRLDFGVGTRPKYLIEPNEVTTLGELESEALEAIMTEQEADKLKIKLNVCAKRVSLHSKFVSIAAQNFVLGRAAGGIEREINDDYPIFGEPMALKVLNGLRLKTPQIGSRDWDFQGVHYDFGEPDRDNVLIPAINLLPMWYNDHNMYDNTLYTGMSAVWPILSIVQANNFINDEDLPESCKALWSKYGFVYVGDKNPESIAKFEKAAKVGTLIYHNNKDLETKFADLKQPLTELTRVRIDNMKAMCIDFGFPMFLLFEDTSNFATAKEVMQAYRAGVLEMDRTMYRYFLEKYWYDPILADHLKVSKLDDLLKAKIQIKAAFDDVNFETRKDVIAADLQMLNAGVLIPLDVARHANMDARVIDRLKKLNEDEQLKQYQEIAKNLAAPPKPEKVKPPKIS